MSSKTNRRGFLRTLLAASAGAAALCLPEQTQATQPMLQGEPLKPLKPLPAEHIRNYVNQPELVKGKLDATYQDRSYDANCTHTEHVSIPAGAVDYPLHVAFARDTLQLFEVSASRPLSIKTNRHDDPDDAFDVPEVGLLWTIDDDLFTCPVSMAVKALFVTNPHREEVWLDLYVLHN